MRVSCISSRHGVVPDYRFKSYALKSVKALAGPEKT
jgi:hypothetical protein